MISSFWLFWTFFGQRMASHACRVDFLHKRIVHNKFQLKIPTLSENDCSATWKPNTYQKYDTCGKVRNVQRYQKYVVLLRSFIFIVSDIFKPTVLFFYLDKEGQRCSCILSIWYMLSWMPQGLHHKIDLPP